MVAIKEIFYRKAAKDAKLRKEGLFKSQGVWRFLERKRTSIK